jgi:hypothetical protein
MNVDQPRITYLAAAAPDRIFRRAHDEPTTSPSFTEALDRVATAIVSDSENEEVLNEIAVSASLAFDSDIGLVRALSDDESNFVIVAASGPAPSPSAA